MAKVVVAMSGGVDSSVAALLLRQAGHDVLGVFMRHGITAYGSGEESCETPTDGRPPAAHRHGCCTAEDAADARRVAHTLGIPFYVLNFNEAFEGIVDNFVAEYAAGRTPNPCIRCNTHVKFGRLWAYADALGAAYIATGHYARLAPPPAGGTRPALLRGLDHRKDQSYVLFGIAPAMLARMLLPVGDFHKPHIRQLALDAGLITHNKRDSYEICFVPDRDYAGFLRERAPQAFVPGEIVDPAGRTLGVHDGLPNFTVGQRHGLGVALGEPAYVTELRVGTHTLVVGRRPDVLRASLVASEANWLADGPVLPAIGTPFRARAQIRANHVAAACSATRLDAQRFTLTFDEPQSAVTPGQAAVLYDADTGQQVLGGGWIASSA